MEHYQLRMVTTASYDEAVAYCTQVIGELEGCFRLRDGSYTPGIKFLLSPAAHKDYYIITLTSQLAYHELINPQPYTPLRELDWTDAGCAASVTYQLPALNGRVPTFEVI